MLPPETREVEPTVAWPLFDIVAIKIPSNWELGTPKLMKGDEVLTAVLDFAGDERLVAFSSFSVDQTVRQFERRLLCRQKLQPLLEERCLIQDYVVSRRDRLEPLAAGGDE